MKFLATEKTSKHALDRDQAVHSQPGSGHSSLQASPTGLLLQRSLGNSYLQTAGQVAVNSLPSDTFGGCDGCVIQRFKGCDGACAGCSHHEDEDQKAVQAKLIVGASGDRYEQEADRMADQVMRMSYPGEPVHTSDGGTADIQRQEEENADNPIASQIEALLAEDGLQAKAEGGGIAVTDGFESTLAATKGGGQSLPNPAKAEMETAFGVDFSGVRLHTDSTAVQMSRQINAHAFTHGQDIYFNEARFHPSSNEGRHLLAHELTHTLQQGGERIQRLTITRDSITRGNCGSRRVRWVFALDSTAPTDGYLVQKVRSYENIQSCPSNVSSVSLTPTLTFWEAWFVNSGDTNEHEGTPDITDQSVRGEGTNQSGLQASLGTVKFFPISVTGDIGRFGAAPADPSSPWGPGKVPRSGQVTSTPSKPSWWDNTPGEGPASRWASSWWNCCGDAANQRNVIDSNP